MSPPSTGHYAISRARLAQPLIQRCCCRRHVDQVAIPGRALCAAHLPAALSGRTDDIAVTADDSGRRVIAVVTERHRAFGRRYCGAGETVPSFVPALGSDDTM